MITFVIDAACTASSLALAFAVSVAAVANQDYQPTQWPGNALHILAFSAAGFFAALEDEETGARRHLGLSALASFVSFIALLWAAAWYTRGGLLSDAYVLQVYRGTTDPFFDCGARVANENNRVDAAHYRFRFGATVACCVLQLFACLARCYAYFTEDDFRVKITKRKPPPPFIVRVFQYAAIGIVCLDVCFSFLPWPRWTAIDSPHTLTYAALLSLPFDGRYLRLSTSMLLVGVFVSAAAVSRTMRDASKAGVYWAKPEQYRTAFVETGFGHYRYGPSDYAFEFVAFSWLYHVMEWFATLLGAALLATRE